MGIILPVSLILSAVWSDPATAKLQPTLLWKRDFEESTHGVMAPITGDVLLGEPGRIVMLDHNGAVKFRIRLGRNLVLRKISTSDDASRFVVSAEYSREINEKKGLLEKEMAGGRVQLYDSQTRSKIWDVEAVDSAGHIAPDGSRIIINEASTIMSAQHFEMRDSKGAQVFTFEDESWELVNDPWFSPDSAYFLMQKSDQGPIVLFAKDGTRIWERGSYPMGQVASVCVGADYVSTGEVFASTENEPVRYRPGVLYDRKGDTVLQGTTLLSGNCSMAAVLSDDRKEYSILRLPYKTAFKKVPSMIPGEPDAEHHIRATFSYDGRFFVVEGRWSFKVYDLVEGMEAMAGDRELHTDSHFDISRDGRYVLVVSPSGPIWYFKLH